MMMLPDEDYKLLRILHSLTPCNGQRHLFCAIAIVFIASLLKIVGIVQFSWGWIIMIAAIISTGILLSILIIVLWRMHE
jgi:hypothetical protein